MQQAEFVNWVLVLTILCLACLAICLRLSPDTMRGLAAWLRATADAHDARQEIYERQLDKYRTEMRLRGCVIPIHEKADDRKSEVLKTVKDEIDRFNTSIFRKDSGD